MHGVLNLLKPPGMTSHDAVAWARRVFKTRRIGHTGTLDPAASGVLPLCIGQATRLVEDLQAGTKEYIAEALFGVETDSCDATGQTVREVDASALTLDALRVALDSFRGEITQTPPLHSAVKVGGRKLYELARAGETIDIPTRQVTISKLFARRFVSGAQPRAMLQLECSGGTYVRSLVRDIGRELGLAATMTFLVRTRSGAFELSRAVTMEEAEACGDACLMPLRDVLREVCGKERQDDKIVRELAQGKRVPDDERPSFHKLPRVSFVSDDGQLLALAQTNGEFWQPVKVFDLRDDVESPS